MLTKKEIHLYPKAELHCHLDGSIRPATLQKIAAAQQLSIESELSLVKNKMTAPDHCQHLEDYLSCFEYVLPYLQTSIALEMAAFDVMEQAALDGVAYIEIRFAPSLSQQKGLSIPEVILAVITGMKQAEATYPIIGNLLISGMRQETDEQIKAVFNEVALLSHDKVVGIDLAGPEEDLYLNQRDPTIFTVGKHNLQLTLHAGECGCIHNIFEAVHAGAKRIGHGIALQKKYEQQKELAALDICIEGCPTSNVQTKAIASYQDYPFREWLTHNIPFCINTDNRTVSDTTLTKEYSHLLEHFEMTKKEFYQLNYHAVHYSFANEATKSQLLNSMNRAQKKESL